MMMLTKCVNLTLIFVLIYLFPICHGDSMYTELMEEVKLEVKELNLWLEKFGERVGKLEKRMGVASPVNRRGANVQHDEGKNVGIAGDIVTEGEDSELGHVEGHPGKVCLGGNDCCTEESPCYENEGDCDNDDQCQDGLVCEENSCDVWEDWPASAHSGEHSFTGGDDCCKKKKP